MGIKWISRVKLYLIYRINATESHQILILLNAKAHSHLHRREHWIRQVYVAENDEIKVPQSEIHC